MIYAIGDIHGNLPLLQILLGKIRKDAAACGEARPQLVVLGDFIDRGAFTRQVIDLFMSNAFLEAFDAVWTGI
jgi:serine/threonine protein phosphatase 1